jgi:hypothetical protein
VGRHGSDTNKGAENVSVIATQDPSDVLRITPFEPLHISGVRNTQIVLVKGLENTGGGDTSPIGERCEGVGYVTIRIIPHPTIVAPPLPRLHNLEDVLGLKGEVLWEPQSFKDVFELDFAWHGYSHGAKHRPELP